MASYDKSVKQNVINEALAGAKASDLAKKYKMGISTIYYWLNSNEETKPKKRKHLKTTNKYMN